VRKRYSLIAPPFFPLFATHTQTLTYKFNELNEGEKNARFNPGVT